VNVVLGVSGGIAAYKTPDLVRRLRETGADVRVVLTPNAERFVSALSLAAVSGHGVLRDQWGDPSSGGVDHIELARWADVLLIAPATANILAKLAVGIADDALSTYAVAHRRALLIAPAMNTFMYAHPTVRQNLDVLQERGARIIEPDSGSLACGDEGVGRLADISRIVEEVQRVAAARDLEGRRILITAGPTREAIDPVRYLSNRSSGKMGYALADAARSRGAFVTLISGPTALRVPPDVEVDHVVSATEMYESVMKRVEGHHVVIKAAAVADFTPQTPSTQKLKKGLSEDVHLVLRRTPDILSALGNLPQRPFIVAFAAETENLENNAREKLLNKQADLIVANDVSDGSIGFDADHNEILLLSRDGGREAIPRSSKRVIADRILDAVVRSMAS